MSDRLITQQSEFDDLCDRIRQAGIVGFDTEFISEYTFRPELCLAQFAFDGRSFAVDPFEVRDFSRWWDIMRDDETTVVVHGGQAEIRFCLDMTGGKPHNLVDVQLAEGLRSRSYPLGYEGLVSRVMGRRPHGKETRTDWRRRPLADSQIHYALEDVEFLLEIWKRQKESLRQLGRLTWADAEFARMVDGLAEDVVAEGWKRLPGITRLRIRELAVARELYNWRQDLAERKNRPARRVLRDDLIIELARRQPQNTTDLLHSRDMNRSDYKNLLADILKAIDKGKHLPESELPSSVHDDRGDKNQDEQVLGQLLGIALSNRCAELNVAKQLVGTSADLRELVRWHLGEQEIGPAPRLATGWRADVCGDLLTDVLDGKVVLRVSDPNSDHPLTFERTAKRGE